MTPTPQSLFAAAKRLARQRLVVARRRAKLERSEKLLRSLEERFQQMLAALPAKKS